LADLAERGRRDWTRIKAVEDIPTKENDSPLVWDEMQNASESVKPASGSSGKPATTYKVGKLATTLEDLYTLAGKYPQDLGAIGIPTLAELVSVCLISHQPTMPIPTPTMCDHLSPEPQM
jgi:hypothetical protein